ncbi:MAG: DJ-1/PfpI family protein [Cyclobacteriaceae bacterium]|nr:DJ-1/PfpI family protein [Cyclobacteriaceae bacterium]
MKKIAIVLFDEVEVLDFAGPFEVFSVTGKRSQGTPYEVFTVAEKETIAARNNLIIQPTYLFETAPAADIFLVPGGGGYHPDGTAFGSRREMNNPTMLEWVKQQYVKAELALSVCTGALIMAKAGLLNGLQATTHFMAVDTLKEISPTTNVQADQRYVDNGKLILSAGVSAGIDMAFYVVAKLQGPEVALETARYMQYDYWK